MKKYNLSEIMKKAWRLFRLFQESVGENITFGEALRRAWASSKEAVAEEDRKAALGIVRMHYSEYKTSYRGCKTVDGSYDKKTKTIEVYTRYTRSANGLCPRCHTYCYGDCSFTR